MERVLLSIAFLLTLGVTQVMAEGPILMDITPEEAFSMIERNRGNRKFVILDVRTPAEVARGYIEGAINIDFYSKTFAEELDRLDRDKTYLIYCRSGNRSGKTLRLMERLGFKEVYNMTGGIREWKRKGFPLTYPHRSD